LPDIKSKKIKKLDAVKYDGAYNYIDNNFRNIDEVLLLIKNDLMQKGFVVAS
jgi:hypothetical protein